MKIDMWYGDNVKDVTKIDCFFNDCDCVYRGNLYIGDKCVGDYYTNNSLEIEKQFGYTGFTFLH